MMRSKLLIISLLSIFIICSCKSQYEIILDGNDVPLKYKTAFELFEQGKYSKAATMFESLKLAVKGTLQDDTVQFYTGLSQYRFGDMFVAETCFESFIEVFPRSPFSEQARYLYIDCLYYQTLRYELDPTPTHKALLIINQYLLENPESKYYDECKKMVVDLEERLDRKAYEAAKLYYTIEDYKAARYALKNVLKDDADNIYREDIEYYTALAAYKYAFNSVPEKQTERYMAFSDDYYNFVGEFPTSSYRRELDHLFKKVQGFLQKGEVIKRDKKRDLKEDNKNKDNYESKNNQ